MGFAYIKGEFTEEHNARVSLSERAFRYGDGLFETVRVIGGVAIKIDEHVRRIHDSGVELGMLLDKNRSEFVLHVSKVVSELVRQSGYSDARLKIILSRGEGDIGPRPPEIGGANIYAVIQPYSDASPSHARSGISAVLASFPRNQHSPLVQHKTLNFLENVLALKEARDAAVDEALFCNIVGRICEGATSNIFIVKDGGLITPPLSEGLLLGITRAQVLDLAKASGISYSEMSVTLDDLWSSDEAFLTNSMIGIAGLLEVDEQPIAHGGVGSITEQLQVAYQKFLDHLVMTG